MSSSPGGEIPGYGQHVGKERDLPASEQDAIRAIVPKKQCDCDHHHSRRTGQGNTCCRKVVACRDRCSNLCASRVSTLCAGRVPTDDASGVAHVWYNRIAVTVWWSICPEGSIAPLLEIMGERRKESR